MDNNLEEFIYVKNIRENVEKHYHDYIWTDLEFNTFKNIILDGAEEVEVENLNYFWVKWILKQVESVIEKYPKPHKKFEIIDILSSGYHCITYFKIDILTSRFLEVRCESSHVSESATTTPAVLN